MTVAVHQPNQRPFAQGASPDSGTAAGRSDFGSSPGPEIRLSDFTFELLGSELYVLKRGVRMGHASILAVTTTAPAPRQCLRLTYERRHELGQAGVIPLVGLIDEDSSTTLIAKDPGGVLLTRLVSRPGGVTHALKIGIIALRVLKRFHAAGLVHGDLRPSSLIVSPETGEGWLSGAGLAFCSSRQLPAQPGALLDGLHYLAPEQTGRFNQGVDPRSDLYAFGVILYQMLTGRLPFPSSDAMELIHCHVARKPVPPCSIEPGIPVPVSDVVLKLLAKNPEDRYQTARGAEADLVRCLDASTRDCPSAAFPLGSDDVPDRLIVSKQLYGRDAEVAALLAAFDRVARRGGVELTLIAGYSGIGKSSLVARLQQQIAPLRAHFAAGKFDQRKRDIPYATLTQAFATLIRRILSYPKNEMESWREALVSALQPNAKLLTALLPDLESLIGPPPAVTELPAAEEQRRFHTLLGRFVGIFAKKEHPLILFLDDLQWLDAATLDFVDYLLTTADPDGLLLIGAYRDNEVSAAHPLRLRLNAIRQTGARVSEITLASLGVDHVRDLLAATLRAPADTVATLAGLVHGKTGGNPFFVQQFIAMLSSEGLLAFDHDRGAWRWSLDDIRAQGYTDNVGDLLVDLLGKLPEVTRAVLVRLACLGSSADSATLAVASALSDLEVCTALADALHAGLVISHDGRFSFSHDRVEESAYRIIPEQERGALHLEIGRRLASMRGPEITGDFVFEIANQFNRCSALITSREERCQVAALNLSAGRRARAATAYGSALTFLVAAESLLPADRWTENYEVALPTALLCAECEMLTGNLHAADERLANLVPHARSQLDRAAITCVQIDLFTLLDRSDRSVTVGLEYLASIGVNWRPHPNRSSLEQEYAAFHDRLAGRPIESLVEIPLLSDAGVQATMDVLIRLQVPALFFDETLHGMILGREANLSLEHGNSAGSCFAYCWLAGFVGPHLNDYESAPRFARLSLELVEKPPLDRFKARVYCVFGYLVTPWIAPLASGRSPLLRANELARASGDLTFVFYASNHLITLGLAEGRPLAALQDEAERGRDLAQKARFGMVADFFSGQLALIRMLRSVTPPALQEELQLRQRIQSDAQLAIARCWYWIRQVQALYHAGDYAGAQTATTNARPFLWTSTSSFEIAEYRFFAGLNDAAMATAASQDERSAHVDSLRDHHRQIAIWARHCPANFAHRAALLEAELARLANDEGTAQRAYEAAIRLARQQRHVHHEGLAFERAARFYAARGFEDFATTYLLKARECYRRWEADGLVVRLEAEFPQLSDATRGQHTELSVEKIDFENIIKVAQSVSEEIVLEKLIRTVMTATVEHAGADRAVLLLARGEEQKVMAEARTDQDRLQIQIDADGTLTPPLPHGMLRFAARTREPVALDEATTAHVFGADEYLRTAQPRSALCLPLTVRGKSVGLVYLEHSLVSQAFTPGRIKILEVLASQAAISLENARLFAELQESEARFRQFAEKLPEVIWITNLNPERVVYCSPSFERIWGFSVMDLYRDPRLWIASIHPDDRERVTAEFSQWIGGESMGYHDIEFRIIQPDGAVRWILENSVLTRDEQGRPIRVSGISADITQRKEAEEAIQKAHAELTHVARVAMMGQMTASIAHEVNQPLAGIVTNAAACLRWLANEPPNVDRARQAATRIIRDGELAAEVITRLRALFHKAELVRSKLNLNDVVSEVVSLVRGDLRRKRIELQLDLADDLGTISGDRVQVQQVLLNLFRNAIDAMDGVTDRPLLLGVRTRATSQGIEVAVTDTGTGLEGDVLEHMYDAFFTTKASGMGMGLSISRSIVESHGGTLTAANNPERGATFVFRLPVDPKGPA